MHRSRVVEYKNQKSVTESEFITTTNDVSSGTAVETPRFLLTNPANSGKRLTLKVVTFGTNVSTNNNIFRIYVNPTITSNGTPLTMTSLRIGASTPAPVALAFASPTISANGTLICNYIAGATTTTTALALEELILDPGYSILVNVRPNTTGVTHSINVVLFQEDL